MPVSYIFDERYEKQVDYDNARQRLSICYSFCRFEHAASHISFIMSLFFQRTVFQIVLTTNEALYNYFGGFY